MTATRDACGDRRRETLSHGDVRIDCLVEGAGPGIVLLPSLGRGQADFDEVAGLLAQRGFLVLRPEPRGIGDSRGPTGPITLQDLAGDVAHVIATFSPAGAIVLGHAFGNWVARMTAVMHPDLVRGVVLAAAAARVQSPEVRAALEKCHDTRLPRDVRLAALQFAFFAPGHEAAPWLQGWHHAAINLQRAASAASPRETWWHAGAAPILDLQAASDPFRPPSTRRENIDDFGERVSVALIDDASHALMPEQPVAVAAAIASWARQIGHLS